MATHRCGTEPPSRRAGALRLGGHCNRRAYGWARGALTRPPKTGRVSTWFLTRRPRDGRLPDAAEARRLAGAQGRLMGGGAPRHALGVSAMRYVITVAGRLADDWPDWFGPAKVREDPGNISQIVADLPDPSALQGLLAQVAALNLTLLEARLLGPWPPAPQE